MECHPSKSFYCHTSTYSTVHILIDNCNSCPHAFVVIYMHLVYMCQLNLSYVCSYIGHSLESTLQAFHMVAILMSQAPDELPAHLYRFGRQNSNEMVPPLTSYTTVTLEHFSAVGGLVFSTAERDRKACERNVTMKAELQPSCSSNHRLDSELCVYC